MHVYVCVHARAHVFVCVFACVCQRERERVYLCVRVNARVCVYVCVCVCVCVCVSAPMRSLVHTCNDGCVCERAWHISVYTHILLYQCACVHTYKSIAIGLPPHMRWLRLVSSLKSCAKEPYKKDCILQMGPIILRSLLIVATPYLLVSIYAHVCVRGEWIERVQSYSHHLPVCV